MCSNPVSTNSDQSPVSAVPSSSTALFPADPVHALRQTLIAGLQGGRWSAGERLPTERELCERFGVGRSALRRVLGEFKSSGWIEQTVGSGTFVARDIAKKLPPAAEQASVISPAELMEARLLMEPLLVDLIVSKATAADFEAMENCCRQAEAATTLADFEHWDGALHQQLALATHNSFFLRIFQLATEARERGEWGLLKQKSVTPQRRAQYEHEHRVIVRALKARDADTAREALLAHLVNVRTNLFGRV